MNSNQKEFLLQAVKDSSIAIAEALRRLEESPSENSSSNHIIESQIPAQQTRKELIDKLIKDALDGYWYKEDEKEEFSEGLDWDRINNYLKTKQWQAIDAKRNGGLWTIEGNPLLARHNAEDIAEYVLKRLFKKIDENQPGEELEYSSYTGVFGASAWVEGEMVMLEIVFKPDTTFNCIELKEVKNAK